MKIKTINGHIYVNKVSHWSVRHREIFSYCSTHEIVLNIDGTDYIIDELKKSELKSFPDYHYSSPHQLGHLIIRKDDCNRDMRVYLVKARKSLFGCDKRKYLELFRKVRKERDKISIEIEIVENDRVVVEAESDRIRVENEAIVNKFKKKVLGYEAKFKKKLNK